MEVKGRGSCCFLGHRKINKKSNLKNKLYKITEELIVNDGIDIFLFGSKSEFNDLCYEVVTELKKKYSYIKRIYIRAEFPYIDENYTEYLLEYYEDTYYPVGIENAGKAVYVERNCVMIDNSDVCIVYYDENYVPQRKYNRAFNVNKSKSGTKIAYEYAIKKGKKIFNTFNI